MSNQKFRRRREAAAYIKERTGFGTAGTLAKLAVIGGGPRFCYLGRFPIYEDPDLDQWIESKLSRKVNSTSEISSAKSAAA